MSEYKIYKLHFTSPLHISDQRDDSSTSLKSIQSDTMYSALMSCLAKTGHDIPDNGDLGFCLSSLFPFYQKDKSLSPVLFLPVPLNAKLVEHADISLMKKVKKVKWIDSKRYGEVLSGRKFDDEKDNIFSQIQGEYICSNDMPADFMTSETCQRVKIESRTGDKDALPYYVDRITFKDFSGLYFIATGNTSLLETALNILAVEGIGTDRNVGYGLFEYSSGTMTIDQPDCDCRYLLNLSMFFPESESQLRQMLDGEHAAYEVMRRGGWITTYPFNRYRKNVIYGFVPGSVFSKPDGFDGGKIGKTADLTPKINNGTAFNHHVWRCGKAITLPIKLNDGL
ncbi:MAG: type III-A CRISPR-associated RAMP protein Csm4 [Prevotella sp.]|uniref:type III-A CRISPR-associated RAMP protein Csm4 n=1 Tax=Prevotella sp. TaxID=59823 RepID=UPI002A2ABABF|nr:type III-A CRISPR-associated RAMP protein Csm4 [Prevotella sp.]MDD7318488.1 type III-A CRISPR-associated RAMP protein Csm4 [Prevotellaceae bacterium]MDY4020161.1 type III-A CRISPR-associated RAMP protein Csm4 [Prevotella sp.]